MRSTGWLGGTDKSASFLVAAQMQDLRALVARTSDRIIEFRQKFTTPPDHRSSELPGYYYGGPGAFDLTRYLESALQEWADISFTNATASCIRDQVDRQSCDWYHRAWSALRKLDVVSSPTWHLDFYLGSLRTLIAEHAASSVLIAGTADFSTLAIVLAAAKGVWRPPSCDVIDLCPTPLGACAWYADRTGARIKTYQADLLAPPSVLAGMLRHSSPPACDLVVSDALLTRFAAPDALRVLRNWFALLAPAGSVVTTVRLHPRDRCQDPSAGTVDFIKRVAKRADPGFCHTSKIDNEQLLRASDKYAERMVSYDLGDLSDVLRMFSSAGFKIEAAETSTVEGELTVTDYARIVARKPG